MTKATFLVAAAVAGVVATAIPILPVAAQSGADHNRVLVIYGNDKCPTSNGEEIVVCVRRNENERYRIPPQFRQSDPLYNKTWADRAKSLEYVGASGVRSCTPVGSGGASGCFDKMMRDYNADRKQIAQDVPVIGK